MGGAIVEGGADKVFVCRNEGFQEELWKKSFEILKEHLSQDTIEKYGPESRSSIKI